MIKMAWACNKNGERQKAKGDEEAMLAQEKMERACGTRYKRNENERM